MKKGKPKSCRTCIHHKNCPFWVIGDGSLWECKDRKTKARKKK